MQVELKRLQREVGVTTIYVTHDQEEALTMSDRIAVMRAGRIEQLGAPAEIYERPESAFVADFIGTTNLFRGRIAGRAGAAVLLECGGATLRAAAGGAAPGGGGEAVVALRPEKVVLGPTGPMDNTLACVVTHLVYLGDSVVYHLRSEEGLELEARELARPDAAAYAVGDRVRAGWQAEHATLLHA
jgi:spermidine/putrescine transport system ATP-binding protein